MPRFDLNGDPLPDDETAQPSPSQGGAQGNQAPPPYQQAARPYAPPNLPRAKVSSTLDPSRVAGAILGITAVVVIGGGAIAMLYPPAVPAPSTYQTYSMPEMSLTIDRPAGWQVLPIDKAQGSEVVKILGGALFKNRTAMIEIAEGTPRDMGASGVVAVADVANGLSMNPADMAAVRYRRLAKNHLWGYRTIGTGYSGTSKAFRYIQQETFMADHPAWSIGGPVKGYFVTEANLYECVAIECECRQSDWKTLQPVFDHVIDSMDSTGFRKELEDAPASPSTPSVPGSLVTGAGQ